MANAKTTPSKPAVSKPARPPKPTRPVKAKAAAAAGAVPEPAAAMADKTPTFRLKTLIDQVADSAGIKRNAAKPIVEATLKAMGDALDTGENLTLPPLGRLRVNRSKDMVGGALLTIKLRRMTRSKSSGRGGGDQPDDTEA